MLAVLDEVGGQSGNPLLRLLVDLLNELTQTPYEQVIRAAVEQAVFSGISSAMTQDYSLRQFELVADCKRIAQHEFTGGTEYSEEEDFNFQESDP